MDLLEDLERVAVREGDSDVELDGVTDSEREGEGVLLSERLGVRDGDSDLDGVGDTEIDGVGVRESEMLGVILGESEGRILSKYTSSSGAAKSKLPELPHCPKIPFGCSVMLQPN